MLESVDQFRFFFFFSSSILMPIFRCCSSSLAQFSPPPPKHSTHSFTVTTASSCELASLELVAGNAFDVVMCEVRQDEGEDRDEFTSNRARRGGGRRPFFLGPRPSPPRFLDFLLLFLERDPLVSLPPRRPAVPPRRRNTHARSHPKNPKLETPQSSLVEAQAPSQGPPPAAAALCAASRHLPLILLADPGAAARRAVWIGLDLGAAEVIEKPPAESKLRTVWQHAVRKRAAAAQPPSLPPPSASAAAMRRRSISGALGGGGAGVGCSSGTSLSHGNGGGNGLMPIGDTSRDSFDSGNGGGLGVSSFNATVTSSSAAAQAAAAAAAAQARAAAATAARSAAACRRANSLGARPAPRKFVARSASAARIGGGRGSLDGAASAAALHRAARAASDQHLERLLSNDDALRRSIAPAPSAPRPPAPPPTVLLPLPLGPGEEACDADDAATSAVAAAMTAGLDITRPLTPVAQIIGADASSSDPGDGGSGCVWGTPLLASTAADAAAAAAAVSRPAAPSYRHYPIASDNPCGDDCYLAPAPITSFEESSMLTGGPGGAGGSGSGSGGLSPSESGGNGSGGAGSLWHEPPSSLLSPSSAFDVCYDVRSRGQAGQQQHGHVPLVDLADALDDVSLALGLPALVPPAGKDDRDEEDGVVAKAVAAAAAAASARGGASAGMPPRGPSLFSSAEAAQVQAQARAQAPPTSAPLGLSLKKSPSLLEMINERLTSAVCGTPLAP